MDMDGWSELRPYLSCSCVLQALDRLQFASPTPVQLAAIPPFLRNKDVAVQAETGSGKTLAFVIPAVEILSRRKWRRKETGCLVVLPTRELAVQVAEVFREFLPPSISLVLLIGGTETERDICRINEEGATVVVGTPGRLVDLLGQKSCHLAAAVRALEVLVLDEADRLLELGFQQSISTILSYLPKQRRTGLFSATLSHEVEDLIRAGLRNPVNIAIRGDEAGGVSGSHDVSTPSTLTNYYLECPFGEKLSYFINFLSHHKDSKLIVFFATCAAVSYFSTITQRLLPNHSILSLHGRMHKKRQSLFDKFMDMCSGVLMCTDVMSRGVDIPLVDWVIQFDPPSTPKAFVHRCGRTARMGQQGSALLLLLPSETAYVEYLQLSHRVVLEELPPAHSPTLDHTPSIPEQVRAMASKERELCDLAVRAFVSFVRFYYKHECQLIFRPKLLDLPRLAGGTYALLQLPKMPELKHCDTSSFTPHALTLNDVPYKNTPPQPKLTVSKDKGARHKNIRNKDSFLRKRKRPKQTVVKHRFSSAELDELAHDARLVKKYKSGKITKEQMESMMSHD